VLELEEVATLIMTPNDMAARCVAREALGAEFIGESGGPGVRLRKRQEEIPRARAQVSHYLQESGGRR